MAIDFKKLVKGLFIKDSSDPSKGLKLEIDPTAATNTTTTILAEQQANVLLSLPGENSELVGDIASQTLENKTIDAANNTIVGITDAEISATAGIDATKIGDGSVDNTEFQYLNGVSSNIQTQLSNNASAISDHVTDTSGAHAASAISNTPSGNLSATDLQAAVNELQSDIDTRALASNLTAHITDTTDSHLASAIGYSGNANFTVEGALDNLYTYKLTVGSSQQLVSDLNANNNKITALGTPVSGTDAANKNYVDGIAAGLDPKESVRVATTASVGGSYATTPSNGRFTGAATTIDGVTLATNDRVLIKDQADAKQNGIYVYDGAGQYTRSADMDGSPSSEVSGGNFVFVAQGTTNGASGYVLVASGIVTLNTDNLNFTQFSGGANSANKTLSNLDAPTSINQDLLPSSNNSKSLGSASLNYQNAYITTLKDNSGVDSHAVSSRILKDSAGSNSIDYSNTSEVSFNSKKLNSLGSAAGLNYATTKQNVQEYIKNLIPDGDAEGANIISVYNDSSTTRPVDGTGGTQANLTPTITSTNPLSGTNSFLLTKSGSASTQGSGFSIPFTVPIGQQAKVLQIDIDYIVNSGTFVAGSSSAESDMIVYIYDVTNSTLIEPSSIKFLSNSSTISDKFTANFQTSATGTSYRLILHCQSTSTANYALKCEFSVKPCNYVYGTPITDSNSITWTPNWTSTGTTPSLGNGAISGIARRSGDRLQGTIKLTSGSTTTFGTGDYKFSIPYTIDTSKTPSGSTSDDDYRVGYGSILQIGVNRWPFFVNVVGTNTLSLNLMPDGTSGFISSNTRIGSTIPFTGSGANEILQFNFDVPIQGWSSSTQVSDGYDGRLIAAQATTASQTITAGGTRQIVNGSTVTYDKTGSITTGASWKFTAPSQGIYEVKYVSSHSFATYTTGAEIGAELYKNGSFAKPICNFMQQAATGVIAMISGSVEVELNANDYIDVREFIGGSVNSTINGATIYISKKQAPTTMSATEVVAAKYYGIPTGSIGSPHQTITYPTKAFDTHNAYSGGTYTIPVAGIYEVYAYVEVAGTETLGQSVNIATYKNGSVETFMATTRAPGTVSNTGVGGSTLVSCVAGDTIQIKVYTDISSPSYVYADATPRFEIKRIK